MSEPVIEMDLFMQSDAKKLKPCEPDQEKIILLQVKMDKVAKEILDFPISMKTLENDVNNFKTKIMENREKDSKYFDTELTKLKELINGLAEDDDIKYASDFRKKARDIIAQELKNTIQKSRNPFLIDLFESKIKTVENLFDNDNFVKKIEDKIESSLSSEIKEESGLKRNENLIQFIKNQVSNPSSLFQNKNFITQLENEITPIISKVVKEENFQGNKHLVPLIKKQIPLPKNIFQDVGFNNKLIEKIETMIYNEVNDINKLKKNNNLIHIIKEYTQAEKLIENKDFKTLLEKKISESANLKKIENDVKLLDDYTKEKVKNFNIEIALLKPSNKRLNKN